ALPPQRPVIREESAPAPVTAALAYSGQPATAPGNPNPRPGVLGTLHSSQLTTASVTPRNGRAQQAQAAPAQPETTPQRRGEWSIQLGAFPTEAAALATLREARESNGSQLGSADPYTERVERSGMTLIRARFAGFDRASADAACRVLKRNDYDCMPVRN
ncbi:SPOR domain-containing protein, partial [Phreatobacter sp. AB_2022a]|uniref:SPOR domain-containing protein n=1 Tax=Phreatobacter sp. AB_2022a TaxID=3003134 RepID=UPI0022871E5D